MTEAEVEAVRGMLGPAMCPHWSKCYGHRPRQARVRRSQRNLQESLRFLRRCLLLCGDAGTGEREGFPASMVPSAWDGNRDGVVCET